jgi:uncharacterized cupin superfamily protein
MYLSAEKIAEMKGVRRIHNLNPSAVRVNKSLGDEVGLKNIGVHLMTIAPGVKSTEFHAHKYEDEAIYVLSGQGAEVIGDESYKIGPGDFIGLPAGGPAHETINDGTEPLVCLVIGQRLAQEVVDYPRVGKRLYRNSGQRDMVDHGSIEKR